MKDFIMDLLQLKDSGELKATILPSDSSSVIIELELPLKVKACPFCGYRMYSKGVYTRTVKHPLLQDGRLLMLKLKQRKWKCDNSLCGYFETDKFSFVDKNRRITNATDFLILRDFKDYNVSLRNSSNSEWKNLASTLKGLAARDQVKPIDQGQTDQGGKLTFPTGETLLEPGLYLVTGSKLKIDRTTYDPSPFVVMLPYNDEKTGQLKYHVDAAVKYTYKSDSSDSGPPSSKTVSRKVIKVWEDAGYEDVRPDHIEVQLLKNGKVYDTAELNEKNNWRYTWTDLDSSAEWDITEEKMDSYAVEVYREGITFVVTNTSTTEIFDDPVPEGYLDFPEPPEITDLDEPEVPKEGVDVPEENTTESSEPSLPQTGQLWWPVPVLIMAGLLCLMIGLVFRKYEDYKDE